MVYNIYTTYFCNGYDWGMVPGIALPTLFFLVGGFNHLEKHEFVNGKDDIPYMKWKIKAMFQTTNHL